MGQCYCNISSSTMRKPAAGGFPRCKGRNHLENLQQEGVEVLHDHMVKGLGNHIFMFRVLLPTCCGTTIAHNEALESLTLTSPTHTRHGKVYLCV